jgi:hypothetical protein
MKETSPPKMQMWILSRKIARALEEGDGFWEDGRL